MKAEISNGNAEVSKPPMPFKNCRFKVCDLPGQCIGEGRCHHPVIESTEKPE